jgi:hypothetical protein
MHPGRRVDERRSKLLRLVTDFGHEDDGFNEQEAVQGHTCR